jgi:transcriptional regulator with XRE-family HTH domain
VDDVTNVRQLRESYGWSRRKTALLVGLSEGELRKVEAGTRRLSGPARMRYINAFDLDAVQVRAVAELSPFREGVSA